MSQGRIYGIAGNGRPGYTGDGGPAASARVGQPPGGVAFDGAGNLLIADTGNNRIRVVPAASGTFYGQAMTLAHIYTVAGNGTGGFAGDGGPATAAKLNAPGAVTVDAAGNLVIADTYNNRIRVVAAPPGTFYGQAMTAGDIYTVAGNGTFGFAGDGSQATSAEMRDPTGVTVDGSGNLLISDYLNQRIRLVAIASGTYYGTAAAGDDIVTMAGNGVAGFLGDSHRATSAELNSPQATGVDGSGNLLIVDTGNGRVREVNGSAQELNR